MDFAQYGSIECSGSAQTVDAQCVVAAVLRSPFFVVDYARRYGVFVDVRKHVCTYNHGALLLVEGCNHLGQGVLIGIYVIAVQLHGKFAALGMLYTCIPATADAQIIALRHDVYQTWVVLELVDSLGGTVCRVVVNDDEVEGEVGLLGQDAAYSIADSTNAVAHGDDHRSLVFEVALVEVDFIKFRLEVSSYSFEVRGAGLFHFDLDAAVLGVYIIKYFFAALTIVNGYIAVEVFVDVYDGCYAAQTQTQVVETGSCVVYVDTGGSLLEDLGVKEEHRAKVEVVAERAFLIIDDRSIALFAFDDSVRVGIHHTGLGISGQAHKAVKGKVSHHEVVVFGVQQCVGCLGGLGNLEHGI